MQNRGGVSICENVLFGPSNRQKAHRSSQHIRINHFAIMGGHLLLIYFLQTVLQNFQYRLILPRGRSKGVERILKAVGDLKAKSATIKIKSTRSVNYLPCARSH